MRRSTILTFSLAAFALAWTAVGVADTATTWRAFARWEATEFTVSRYLASELFGLVRGGLPKRDLKYEGHLQGVAILSWPALAALAAATVWWARRQRRRAGRPRRALTVALVVLLVGVPLSGLAAYISWQCIFVSPKEVFEGRAARQAVPEGREPTPDELVRASELAAQFDAWRRESVLHLFQPYRPPNAPAE